ncbi:HD domain-containing protein [Viridibacillus arvi]|uniref:HD domain-containing protein n=1 Tax=Viridibacillus arvi TaxID=263475 RepID=UPI0034CF41C8
MIINSLLYATEKHVGQTRICGKPYISHPIAVAKILEQKGFLDPRYIITALFHDLLEDTNATHKEILDYGGPDVLTAVKVLTKFKGYQMDEYIKAIRNNIIAKMVKLADRLHNLQSAVVASEKFRIRYIKETEAYYLDLSKDTPFEEDIIQALNTLKATF